MVEAAEEILGMPVRLGFPVGVKGIVQLVQGPQYAAGVGLVRYGAQRLIDLEVERTLEVPNDRMPVAAANDRRKFWSWLRDAF
jgi:cell division protein FtsA